MRFSPSSSPSFALAILVFFPFIILFSGCAAEKKNTVNVRVVDLAGGKPLTGAGVEIYPAEGQSAKAVASATTGPEGIVSLTLPAAQGDGKPLYSVSAHAKGYPAQTKTNVDFQNGATLTFQLEPAGGKPIPKGRYYEDAVVFDALAGAGVNSGKEFTLLLYKVIVDDSLVAESAMFRLQHFGSTVSTKLALQGEDLADVFTDENGSRMLSSSVVVGSLGFDEARNLGYADISIPGQ